MRKNLSIKVITSLFLILIIASAAWNQEKLAFAQSVSNMIRLVECRLFDAYPESLCVVKSGATGEVLENQTIELMSELGSGDQARFEESSNLIIHAKKDTNTDGSAETVRITTQVPLTNGGKTSISRDATGSPVIVAAQNPIAGITTKDAIIIMDPLSGVKNLEVNASSNLSGRDAGNVLIVADTIKQLTIRTNGYNGSSGESARTTLAKQALSGSGIIPAGVVANYVETRRSNPNLSLEFLDSDLNDYEGAGLQCQPWETRVGVAGSEAYESPKKYVNGHWVADDVQNVPEGITMTAARREEAYRTQCLRPAEFSVSQLCEAQKEYSFQAICKIEPEGRSLNFYKRDVIKWKRKKCGT